MNKEDFKTHSFLNAYLLNCLLTGAFRIFTDIFIYVTNNKFLCINSHNYIYYFFCYVYTFNSFKNSSAHTICKILARLHFLLQFLLQFPGVPPLHFLGLPPLPLTRSIPVLNCPF